MRKDNIHVLDGDWATIAKTGYKRMRRGLLKLLVLNSSAFCRTIGLIEKLGKIIAIR